MQEPVAISTFPFPCQVVLGPTAVRLCWVQLLSVVLGPTAVRLCWVQPLSGCAGSNLRRHITLRYHERSNIAKGSPNMSSFTSFMALRPGKVHGTTRTMQQIEKNNNTINTVAFESFITT